MSTLSVWSRRDPFAELDSLVRAAFRPVPGGTRHPHGFTPAAEVERDGDDAVVRLELPGLDVDTDVTVEVDHRRLVVRGERRDERAEDTPTGHLREVRYGSFRRTFSLPESVTDDAVTATYDAGVLTVRIAGAHVGTQPRRVPITAGPGGSTEESAA